MKGNAKNQLEFSENKDVNFFQVHKDLESVHRLFSVMSAPG